MWNKPLFHYSCFTYFSRIQTYAPLSFHCTVFLWSSLGLSTKFCEAKISQYFVKFCKSEVVFFYLKGQSNEIFDLQFISSFEPALASNQWVKIFSILVKNSQIYSNFKSKNLTSWGIIPRRVRLPVVSYPGKSISPGYHTPASQSSRGIIPRRVNKKSAKTWLPEVWYPGESISPGYHTPAS